MTHIAFIAHLSEVSGAGIALVDTVAGLQSNQMKASLILPGRGELVQRAETAGIKPVIIENPEVDLGSAGLTGKIRLLKSRMDYVRHLTAYLQDQQVDLAYINSSATVFPALAARRAKIPIVWHIHETLDSNDKRTRLKAWLIRHWANGLLYASKSAMATLPHPTSRPSLIVRNAIDVDRLIPLGESRLTNLSSSAELPTILMNGTIPRKGADVLLRAAALLAENDKFDFRIAIAGPPVSDEKFGAELKTLSEIPSLKSRINFTGLQKSMVPLYEQAAVFVSASRNEALPIAIVEAMAAGVPVIATDVGDCADLLDNGECGWIVPTESPEALAAAVEDVLESPQIASERAFRAHQKVTRIYANPDFRSELKQFLLKIISDS